MATTTLQRLLSEAHRLDAHIVMAHLDPPLRAHWDDDCRELTVGIDLTMAEKKEAIAHELGHALYGHRCSTPENERAADRRAAELLVDPLAYRAAEILNPDPQAIADELGLTRRMIRVYQRHHAPRVSLMKRYRSAS